MMEVKDKVFAVDFDGTCVTHEYPKIGRSIGAQRVLKRIMAEGGKIVLWTMRDRKELHDAVDWFEENGIELYGIQMEPTQRTWTSSPKAHAQVYIDDHALGCPLRNGLEGERPYVDWKRVEDIIFGS